MKDTVKFFSSPEAFRAWLAKHHSVVDAQWVGFYKKGTGQASITWAQSVDEALCFGWIDGIRKKIDEQAYKIRFTPRRPTSTWSARNIGRAEAMIAAGRMREPGLLEFRQRREDKTAIHSYEQANKKIQFAEDHEKRFRRSAAAWEYFQAQAPWYRRTATYWVISAKKEETRLRRLSLLMEYSAAQEPIPQLDRRPR